MRPSCTCYGRFAVCPACLADAQHPETRGRHATTQAAVVAAMQPPGSWHRAQAVAARVQRLPERVYEVLNELRKRGLVERQGTRLHYAYTLREEEREVTLPTTEAELAMYLAEKQLHPVPGSEPHVPTMGEAGGVPFVMTMPVRLVSESNEREHWASKAKRVKRQRRAAYQYCWCRWMHDQPCYPLTVTITRIAPRTLDSDNLVSSCKAVQDGVADWLAGGPGLGQDRHPLLTWVYAQRTGKPKQYAVEIALDRSIP